MVMGFVLQGKHTFATVHTDNVNEETMGQIIQMCFYLILKLKNFKILFLYFYFFMWY